MQWTRALAVVAAMGVASAWGVAEAKTLKMATDSGAKGSAAAKAIDTWAQLIEERTNGEIEVQVFYQNELGGQQEVFDLLMAGDVDIMLNWPVASYEPRVSMLYTPYMFSTWETALEAYAPGGWLSTAMTDVYADMGLKFFGAWPEGFNGVATSGSYATSVETASDLKVRVPPIFPFPEILGAMGYQTAAIDWGEIFTAVQTGVVDGDAANVIFYDHEYFRDVMDYYVQSKQNFITGILSMNLDEWESLDEAHQKVIADSAFEVMVAQFKAAQEQNAFYVEEWQKAGNTYIEPTDEEIAALAAKVRDEVWPVMEERIGKEAMDIIRANSQVK